MEDKNVAPAAETPVVAPPVVETPVAETPVAETPEVSLLAGDVPEAKAEEKPAEPEVEKDEVPANYEFNIAEGQELDGAMVEAFKPLAKELGLGQKAAQKLVDMVASHAQKAFEAQKKQEAETIAGFKKQILDDPKHVEMLSNAKLTINKFGAGNVELKQLTDGWLGNHPAFVKFLANIGSHLREADMIPGAPAGSSGGGESLGSKLYPDMPRKKS